MATSAHPVLQNVRQLGASSLAATLSDRHLLERFVSRNDETAFAALVCRHGPLVLSVCRRVLHDAHAAEDAFQATFFVLARKAGSLRRPDVLGPYLYGVAYRTARKALARTARRRQSERQAAALRPTQASDELGWHELCQVLDDAVLRLPEKYRVPLVLHCLQGKTVADVARQLGCPQGTVATRLGRAREQLRARLARRGVAVSAAMLAGALQESVASAGVPTALLAGIGPAATVAGGEALGAGAVWATATALAQGGKSVLALSGKVAAVVLLVAGVAGGAAVLSGQGTSPGAQTARACAETPMAVAPAAAERDVVLFLDGSSHFLRGDYTSADRSFHRLKALYPDSPLAPKAVELAVLAKQMGTGTMKRQAAQGRDQVREALQGLPQLLAGRADPKAYAWVFDRVVEVLSASFEVTYANPYDGRIETGGTKQEGAVVSAVREYQAAKDFNVAEYYRKTGHPGSAVFYYELVCRRYPGTVLALTAAERCRELNAGGTKQHRPPVSRIAVTINGEALLVEEVHAAAYLTLAAPGRLTAAERERRIARMWNETLARLIERELVLQDAYRRPGAQVVVDRLEQVAGREFSRSWPAGGKAGRSDEKKLDATLRSHGTTLAVLRRQWERDFLAREVLRSRVRREGDEWVRQEGKRIVAQLKRRAVIEYPNEPVPAGGPRSVPR
jgi:RNA polymerase sigma factor (sigma-70 family)